MLGKITASYAGILARKRGDFPALPTPLAQSFSFGTRQANSTIGSSGVFLLARGGRRPTFGTA
jgi:hypothetical protein